MISNKLVDQASRRELRLESMAENLFETTLVVVEPLQVFIVHGPNVHHYVTGVQRCRVSRSDQLFQVWVSAMGGRAGSTWHTCIGVGRRLPKHVHR